MGIVTPLQVCMDSSDLFQGLLPEDNNMGIVDNPSPTMLSSGEELLACSRPLMERRLRPQHDQPMKCPRCESTNTKFCYYNNYSLSQPRYFCKSCRRYWTKGGNLRNIPVGGGCRKNKRSSNSKTSKNTSNNESSSSTSSPALSYHNNYHNNVEKNQTDLLQLAFHDQMNFSLSSFHSPAPFATNPSFSTQNQLSIDLLDNKYEALLGGSHDFMGNNINGGDFGGLMGIMHNDNNLSPFGIMSSYDHHHHHHHHHGSNNILESSQKLMIPYDYDHHHHNHDVHDHHVKPNAKILSSSIEWHQNNQQLRSLQF